MSKTKKRRRLSGSTLQLPVTTPEKSRLSIDAFSETEDATNLPQTVDLPTETGRSELRANGVPLGADLKFNAPPPYPEPSGVWSSTRGIWHVTWEAVAGPSHRDHSPPLPCQDAAGAAIKPRPALVVADGAGSAAVSEIGAQAVVVATLRFLNTIDQDVAILLDTAAIQDEDSLQRLAMLLVKHAKGTLSDVANNHRRDIRDFRCTFLVAVVGKERILWIKVGDGAIVTEQVRLIEQAGSTPRAQPILSVIGRVGRGEFANQTTFLDAAIEIRDVQWGFVSASCISGIGIMSDGAADKLVANDGSRASTQISHWLDALRQDKLRRHAITIQFSSEEFSKGGKYDDRCIALAADELDV